MPWQQFVMDSFITMLTDQVGESGERGRFLVMLIKKPQQVIFVWTLERCRAVMALFVLTLKIGWIEHKSLLVWSMVSALEPLLSTPRLQFVKIAFFSSKLICRSCQKKMSLYSYILPAETLQFRICGGSAHNFVSKCTFKTSLQCYTLVAKVGICCSYWQQMRERTSECLVKCFQCFC